MTGRYDTIYGEPRWADSDASGSLLPKPYGLRPGGQATHICITADAQNYRITRR